MPIYPYRCNGCGHELETFQKMSDPKLTDWIERLLAKDPRERPRTATDAWHELEESTTLTVHPGGEVETRDFRPRAIA